MASKSERTKRMHSEYGTSPYNVCGNCCNYQKSEHKLGQHCCIAYGDVDWTDCEVDYATPACGIYNHAFHGLRPKRTPLVNVYESPPKGGNVEGQCNLF